MKCRYFEEKLVVLILLQNLLLSKWAIYKHGSYLLTIDMAHKVTHKLKNEIWYSFC